MINEVTMNKEDLKREMNNTIDDLASKINEMEAKKDHVKQEAQSKYYSTLQMLREKKSDLKTKYNEIEDATGDKWHEIKNSLDSAKDYFKKGVGELASAF